MLTHCSYIFFLDVVAIIGWNKLLNKCYCRRGAQNSHAIANSGGLPKRKNSDLMDSLNVAMTLDHEFEAKAIQQHVGVEKKQNSHLIVDTKG